MTTLHSKYLTQSHLGPYFRFQMQALLGTGVFNSDGKLHVSVDIISIEPSPR